MNVESYPFPHVVLDGWWEDRLLRKARREINERVLTIGFDNQYERKLGAPFSAGGHYCATVRSLLAGDAWISQIEQAFGYEPCSLSFDDIGGGVHWIPTGGFLARHVDFAQNGQGLWRRINCLIYLNDGWRSGDGGELELAAEKDGPTVVQIEPVWNRTVVFETSDTSWHGHPEPLVRGPRVSFAGYYFASGKPEGLTDHSTVFA